MSKNSEDLKQLAKRAAETGSSWTDSDEAANTDIVSAIWSLTSAVYIVASELALAREESNRQKTYCAKCGQGFTDMVELDGHLRKCFP